MLMMRKKNAEFIGGKSTPAFDWIKLIESFKLEWNEFECKEKILT